MRRLILATFLALGLFALLSVASFAQARLTIQPAQITVAGVRGERATRTLILRATTPLTSVQLFRQELIRTDGASTIPTDAIYTMAITNTITANTVLTMPVQIDLPASSSGEFAGSLLVSYAGGEATVPITARVKDPPALALLVLVAGVLLGLGLSAYRVRGRPRDEILVRAGRLRSQIRLDTDLASGDLASPFRERIDGVLISADAALQAEDMDAARQAVSKAAAIVATWQMHRDDWLAQLAYQAQLVQQLANLDLSHTVAYLLAVRRSLADAARTAPDLAGPHELQALLQTQALMLERFFRMYADLERLSALPRDRLGKEQESLWTIKILQLQRRLYDLAPDDRTASDTLQQEILTQLGELIKLLAQQGDAATSATRGIADTVAVLFDPAPGIRPVGLEAAATGAVGRLTIFKWSSWLVAIMLLAGAGFADLYVARATFGANPWLDYFTLLAWGFGAEATRASVTDLLQTWGMPVVGAAKSS
jgi:hypothetical protein